MGQYVCDLFTFGMAHGVLYENFAFGGAEEEQGRMIYVIVRIKCRRMNVGGMSSFSNRYITSVVIRVGY